MKEGLGESLSALLDGEANELELERLLKQSDSDDELRATWRRLNAISASMRGEELALGGLDISGRVRAALEAGNESVAETQAAPGLIDRIKRPLASFAVAASVAASVVLGGQQLAQLGGDASAESSVIASRSSPVGMINTIGGSAVQATYGTAPIPTLEPATRTAYRKLAQQRLERYLQEHSEHAALNSHQGMITFARVSEIQE
jgi:sigma-E factor negative regulatory protein RseA